MSQFCVFNKNSNFLLENLQNYIYMYSRMIDFLNFYLNSLVVIDSLLR